MNTAHLSLLSLALLLPACSTVPETGRRQLLLTSESYETALGVDAYRQILDTSNIERGTARAQMVERVGQRIAAASGRNYQWEFSLIVDDQAVNAFCLPGGKIAVYTGILPLTANEDGLAIIMGHEVAHATSRHGGERMSQGAITNLLGTALAAGLSLSDMDESNQQWIMAAFGAGSQVGFLLPYSRTHESEADEIGLRFAIRAGYDPHEAPRLWERMAQLSGNRRPEFLSTHPDPLGRAQHLRELIPRLLAEERPGRGR